MPGDGVVLYLVGQGPPGNDRATLDQLRSQFAHNAWEPSLVNAYWRAPDELHVGLDSDDRRIAMAACSDLTDLVKERTSVGPDGVIYTYHFSDGTLFISDQSGNLLVTNFLYTNSGCSWRR